MSERIEVVPFECELEPDHETGRAVLTVKADGFELRCEVEMQNIGASVAMAFRQPPQPPAPKGLPS